MQDGIGTSTDLWHMPHRQLITNSFHVCEEGRDGPTWPCPKLYWVKGLPHDHVSIYHQNEVFLWLDILYVQPRRRRIC